MSFTSQDPLSSDLESTKSATDDDVVLLVKQALQGDESPLLAVEGQGAQQTLDALHKVSGGSLPKSVPKLMYPVDVSRVIIFYVL